MRGYMDHAEWLVTVPDYNAEGVVIDRFTVSEQQAQLDQLRAMANPQRPDRSVLPGTYTRITVDGALWMSDTPAEIADLRDVDTAMSASGSMLIVGVGLGVVLQRAITAHDISGIDVVEIDERVIKAVAPHYTQLANEHNIDLAFHHSDIHEWRPEKHAAWDTAWFDIWLHIDCDDLPEVTRLRNRYRRRCGWVGAWAQSDRIAQKRRVASGRGFY